MKESTAETTKHGSMTLTGHEQENKKTVDGGGPCSVGHRALDIYGETNLVFFPSLYYHERGFPRGTTVIWVSYALYFSFCYFVSWPAFCFVLSLSSVHQLADCPPKNTTRPLWVSFRLVGCLLRLIVSLRQINGLDKGEMHGQQRERKLFLSLIL